MSEFLEKVQKQELLKKARFAFLSPVCGLIRGRKRCCLLGIPEQVRIFQRKEALVWEGGSEPEQAGRGPGPGAWLDPTLDRVAYPLGTFSSITWGC